MITVNIGKESKNMPAQIVNFLIKIQQFGSGEYWISGNGFIARILSGDISVGQYWLLVDCDFKIWNQLQRQIKYKTRVSALTWGQVVARASEL